MTPPDGRIFHAYAPLPRHPSTPRVSVSVNLPPLLLLPQLPPSTRSSSRARVHCMIVPRVHDRIRYIGWHLAAFLSLLPSIPDRPGTTSRTA